MAVSNCCGGAGYATGELAGGLVGFFITYDRITSACFKTPTLPITSRLSGGPIAGGNATVAKDGEATAANCYYNVYKTARKPRLALSSAVGKTTGQMKTQEFAQHLSGSDICRGWTQEPRWSITATLILQKPPQPRRMPRTSLSRWRF